MMIMMLLLMMIMTMIMRRMVYFAHRSIAEICRESSMVKKGATTR